MKIYIDIDDVVRDMGTTIIKSIGKKPKKWSEGKVIFKIIKENPELLTQMGITKYFEVIKKYFKKPYFLSAQVKFWRPFTEIWLQNNFGEYNRRYVDNSNEKLKYLKNEDLLIDDSPKFNKFDQIILIDYLYNQEVKNPYARIKNPEELERLLMEIKKEEEL